MARCIIVAFIGAWLMAQQPHPQVTQTELPPPSATQAKPPPAPPAPVATQKPSATKKQVSTKKEAAPTGEKTSVPKSNSGSRSQVQLGNENPPKTETAPSSNEGGKQSSGKRVAAFWVILPGK